MLKTAFKVAQAMRLDAILGLHTPDWVGKVLGFHHLYEVPIKSFGSLDPEFEHMDDARVALRLGLVTEEVKELFEDGFGIRMHITFTVGDDDMSKGDWRTGDILEALQTAGARGIRRNGAQVADASGDIVYVLIGMMIEMGYDLRPVIDEIHASNLTKLGENGKPILRSDGKVLKGPSYTKPNIPAALGWTE